MFGTLQHIKLRPLSEALADGDAISLDFEEPKSMIPKVGERVEIVCDTDKYYGTITAIEDDPAAVFSITVAMDPSAP